MLHKTITIKGFTGASTEIKKQFQDEKHFNNWSAKVNKSGAKIIGSQDTEFLTDAELRTYLEGRGHTEATILEWIEDKNKFIETGK